MSSPEGRWWNAKRALGEALQENHGRTERYRLASARATEVADLARKSAQTEAALDLARVQLDLALVRDRRLRSAFDHAAKMALLRGALPNSSASYVSDPQLAEAQAAFDAAQSAHRTNEQMLEGKVS